MLAGVGASIGMNGLMYIVINLLGIYLGWVLVQELKLDALLKRPRSPQGRMFQVVAAILIGHGLARFVIDYLNWSQMLKGFVE